MADHTQRRMTVKRFGAHAPRITAAMKRAAEMVSDIKMLMAEPPSPLSMLRVVAEGDGWLIVALFGREILFRAEVTWDTPEPRAAIAAYLNEHEFGDATVGPEWKPLEVSVQSGRVPANEDGETVSEEWYLIEGALTALYARQVVFRPAIPSVGDWAEPAKTS